MSRAFPENLPAWHTPTPHNLVLKNMQSEAKKKFANSVWQCYYRSQTLPRWRQNERKARRDEHNICEGQRLKLIPSFDPRDIRLALFLLGRLKSQRFGSVFVLRAFFFLELSSKFCFILKLQCLWPLKPNSVSWYLQWNPPVCFRKKTSALHAWRLDVKTSTLTLWLCMKWKAKKDVATLSNVKAKNCSPWWIYFFTCNKLS